MGDLGDFRGAVVSAAEIDRPDEVEPSGGGAGKVTPHEDEEVWGRGAFGDAEEIGYAVKGMNWDWGRRRREGSGDGVEGDVGNTRGDGKLGEYEVAVGPNSDVFNPGWLRELSNEAVGKRKGDTVGLATLHD